MFNGHHFTDHEKAALKTIFAITARTNILDLMPGFLDFTDMLSKASEGYAVGSKDYRVTIIGTDTGSRHGVRWELETFLSPLACAGRFPFAPRWSHLHIWSTGESNKDPQFKEFAANLRYENKVFGPFRYCPFNGLLSEIKTHKVTHFTAATFPLILDPPPLDLAA